MEEEETELTKEQRRAAVELLRRRAHDHLLEFITYCWQIPKPFLVGRHTRAFCEWFDEAMAKWKRKEDSYCLFNTPPRHGKSELCQYACAFFLGHLQKVDPHLIYTGYADPLVKDFSRKIQSIIQSPQYRAVFPEVELSPDDQSVNSWSIKGSTGKCTFTGLSGSLTGKGANLIILDDYCKNAEDAASKVIRDKTWDEFGRSLMSRAMSPCITIVTATPWHPDDITCRIIEKGKRNGEFPKFDRLKFPAYDEKYGWLFPALFTKGEKWYKERKALVGDSGWNALYMCDPVGEGTLMFNEQWFQVYDNATPPKCEDVYMFVDPAGAESKGDSDYMVFWVVGFHDGQAFVLDGVRDRLNMTQRTDIAYNLMKRWRPRATYYEQCAAQTDLITVRRDLQARNMYLPMIKLPQNKNKENRVYLLEPLFSRGKIWFPAKLPYVDVQGDYHNLTQTFLEEEYSQYPMVTHDDMIDCLANIVHPVVGDLFGTGGAAIEMDPTSPYFERTMTSYSEARRRSLLDEY